MENRIQKVLYRYSLYAYLIQKPVLYDVTYNILSYLLLVSENFIGPDMSRGDGL